MPENRRLYHLGLALSIWLSGTIEGGQCWSMSPSSTEASRRDVLRRVSSSFAVLATGGTLLGGNPAPSLAASVPNAAELSKLQKGHARVQYLLAHWDELTSSCGTKIMSDTERKQVVRTEGGGGGSSCDKTPLKVQEFMGYKSTEDPLYKADKLMLKAAPLVDPDSFEDYLDVVERYRDKADQSAMMAYTSSWGEANPNGGREVVDEYLERTKDDVLATEKLLKSVLGYLNLEVLPPLKG